MYIDIDIDIELTLEQEIQTYSTEDIQNDLALGMLDENWENDPLNIAFLAELKKRSEKIPANPQNIYNAFGYMKSKFIYDLV